ncbi:MAG: ComF family protein [Marinicella pacifica]
MKRCAICHCYSKNLLCNGCRPLIQPPDFGCRCCAKPLPKPKQADESLLCADCRAVQPAFDGICCAGVYQPPGRQWVMALKFSNQLHWARIMAELMGPLIQQMPTDWPLIAMPLHPKRLRHRGYNQAREIARQLSKLCERPLISKVLIRTKYTAMQATLPEKQRRSNVRNAFEVLSDELPAAVIVVDDVLTTGQTLSAAAKALKIAGVQVVYGAVFLRASG